MPSLSKRNSALRNLIGVRAASAAGSMPGSESWGRKRQKLPVFVRKFELGPTREITAAWGTPGRPLSARVIGLCARLMLVGSWIPESVHRADVTCIRKRRFCALHLATILFRRIMAEASGSDLFYCPLPCRRHTEAASPQTWRAAGALPADRTCLPASPTGVRQPRRYRPGINPLPGCNLPGDGIHRP